jgi:hypothetical protein
MVPALGERMGFSHNLNALGAAGALRRYALAVVAMPLVLAQPALAQTTEAAGRTVYDAVYFVTFAPANALQMVERVPGFNLEIVDKEIRGFGQAAGNVVINGQRPSSKSDTLDVILMRIPASRVARIEVGPGDLFGSEYSGKSQVLNIVLTDAGGLSGTVEASVRREFAGALIPEGSASVLLRSGRSTFNLGIVIDNDNTTEEGYDRLIEPPSGREIEYRKKRNVIRNPNYSISGSWEHDGGSTARHILTRSLPSTGSR